MKILLTGKNGQVGFELQRALAPLGEIVAVDQAGCDLADAAAIRRLVRTTQPHIIVNPAAYTAVDQAEAEPQRAQAINGDAPGILGEEARDIGALVVQYSTDYVFDGRKSGAYGEDDAPNPLNVYGRSKLAGERALAASGARCLIFRTSWVYGAHGANFAKTMLRLAAERTSLKVVADQHGAPTSAALIADATAQVLGQYLCRPAGADLQDFPYGLYHLVAGGRTNWHEYAQAVVRATVAHEVGHVLGLTHNFRASTTVAQQRLRDPEWTREHGISGSIMEYNPFNLPLYGEPRAELVQLGLGPYDYWAIEYAYRPLPAEGQAQALAAIAARSASDAAPMPRATRAGVPNRLVSTGTRWPSGRSTSSPGPPARSTRSLSAVISSRGDTVRLTRRSSPAASSWAMKSRRSLYFISIQNELLIPYG